MAWVRRIIIQMPTNKATVTSMETQRSKVPWSVGSAAEYLEPRAL